MQCRSVGSTGLQVTEVCFGGASIGNLYTEVADEEAARAVVAAWDGGVRYFDTAPHYGLGLSERRLGPALQQYARDDFVISTKVGRLLEPRDRDTSESDDEGFAVPATHRRVWDFSRDGVRRSVDQSLTRLRLDRIDLLYLHDPDDHWQQAVEEGFPALAQLRDEGAVRAIGAGMNQSAMLAAFVRETDIDIVMLAGRYTLLDQSALDELLPVCLDRNVGVVAAGVFNSGLLSKPDPQPGMRYDYHDAPTDLVDRAIRIADVCRRHNVTLPSCAFQFASAHPAVVSTAMGARSADRVRQNLALFTAPTPHGLWEDLMDQGLLRSDAAIPLR
ncbi:MAG TPA: aldo/keto reductase [Acidothermaceae bacterium]